MECSIEGCVTTFDRYLSCVLYRTSMVIMVLLAEKTTVAKEKSWNLALQRGSMN